VTGTQPTIEFAELFLTYSCYQLMGKLMATEAIEWNCDIYAEHVMGT
jgi:hypothetical protein